MSEKKTTPSSIEEKKNDDRCERERLRKAERNTDLRGIRNLFALEKLTTFIQSVSLARSVVRDSTIESAQR